MGSSDLIVQRVKDFLRWNAFRFDVLDQKGSVTPADPWGWRRGEGDDGEWWVSPKVWLGTLFEGDEDLSQHAARTLRDLDLLRTQDTGNLQCVVKVRGKVLRAYAVSGGIEAWKPTAGGNVGYGKAGQAQRGGFSGGVTVPAPASASPSPALLADPASLSAMLQQGTALALAKGIEVLGMSPDPQDRNCASILRAQTSYANSIINAQVRVDEAQLRQKRVDAIQRVERLIEEEKERQRRLGY